MCKELCSPHPWLKNRYQDDDLLRYFDHITEVSPTNARSLQFLVSLEPTIYKGCLSPLKKCTYRYHKPTYSKFPNFDCLKIWHIEVKAMLKVTTEKQYVYLPLSARTTQLQLSHLPSFELLDLPQHFLPFFKVNSNYASLFSALIVLLQFCNVHCFWWWFCCLFCFFHEHRHHLSCILTAVSNYNLKNFLVFSVITL